MDTLEEPPQQTDGQPVPGAPPQVGLSQVPGPLSNPEPDHEWVERSREQLEKVCGN
jgi:hypothetical protein